MKQFRINFAFAKNEYFCNIWTVLQDGGSDTWRYVARDGLCYVFINIIDFPAAAGRSAGYYWHADVEIVDLAETNPKTMVDAFRSCGMDDPPDMTTENGRLQMADMLYDYGSKSPIWQGTAGEVTEDNELDENSKSFRSLRKEAREVAEKLLKDEEHRNNELDTRIVNKIGQTAREFAQGMG